MKITIKLTYHGKIDILLVEDVLVLEQFGEKYLMKALYNILIW